MTYNHEGLVDEDGPGGQYADARHATEPGVYSNLGGRPEVSASMQRQKEVMSIQGIPNAAVVAEEGRLDCVESSTATSTARTGPTVYKTTACAASGTSSGSDDLGDPAPVPSLHRRSPPPLPIKLGRAQDEYDEVGDLSAEQRGALHRLAAMGPDDTSGTSHLPDEIYDDVYDEVDRLTPATQSHPPKASKAPDEVNVEFGECEDPTSPSDPYHNEVAFHRAHHEAEVRHADKPYTVEPIEYEDLTSVSDPYHNEAAFHSAQSEHRMGDDGKGYASLDGPHETYLKKTPTTTRRDVISDGDEVYAEVYDDAGQPSDEAEDDDEYDIVDRPRSAKGSGAITQDKAPDYRPGTKDSLNVPAKTSPKPGQKGRRFRLFSAARKT